MMCPHPCTSTKKISRRCSCKGHPLNPIQHFFICHHYKLVPRACCYNQKRTTTENSSIFPPSPNILVLLLLFPPHSLPFYISYIAPSLPMRPIFDAIPIVSYPHPLGHLIKSILPNPQTKSL